MKKLLCMLFIFLGILRIATAESTQNWTPSSEIIAKLEAGIKPGDISIIPHDSHRYIVRDYARYYFGYIASGHHMIRGEFLDIGGTYTKGIHIVSNQYDLPEIDDGGCHVVNVVYDVEAKHFVSIECNGLA